MLTMEEVEEGIEREMEDLGSDEEEDDEEGAEDSFNDEETVCDAGSREKIK